MKKLTPQDLNALSDRTQLVYAGRDPSEQFGFVNTPIYRGSTVLYPNVQTLSDRSQRFTYGTHGTPTSEAPIIHKPTGHSVLTHPVSRSATYR